MEWKQTFLVKKGRYASANQSTITKVSFHIAQPRKLISHQPATINVACQKAHVKGQLFWCMLIYVDSSSFHTLHISMVQAYCIALLADVKQHLEWREISIPCPRVINLFIQSLVLTSKSGVESLVKPNMWFTCKNVHAIYIMYGNKKELKPGSAFYS